VDIEFENQVTASFLMTAFTNQCARRIRIMGTKGELKGDMESGTIEIIDFVSGTNDLIQLHTPSKMSLSCRETQYFSYTFFLIISILPVVHFFCLFYIFSVLFHLISTIFFKINN